MTPPALLARRVLLGLAAAAMLAAAVVSTTGGFGTSIAGLRVSSHDARRPLLAAVVLGLAAAALRFAPGGRTTCAAEVEWWRTRLPRPTWFPRVRSQWWLHPAILVAAVGVGVDLAQWLRAPPLWLDEEMIAINIRDRSFAGLGGTLWLGQSAPLGWLWSERLVLLLLGAGELGLRVVPMLFGLGTVVGAAWIARRWLPVGAGALFVLLCWLASVLSHYRFELKHYSADVFWALLLPALAVWTAEASTPSRRLRREVLWLTMAGAGSWLGNGALFVAPACLLWLLIAHLRERDAAGAVRLVAAGAIFAALVGGHYMLSLRYTHHNEYLRQYWADRVPPASADLVGRTAWLIEQLPTLGRDAGGTRYGILFWLAGMGGLLIARNRRLGGVYALVPAIGVILALTRLVPVFERFSLWVIPAILLGIALAVSRGVAWLVEGVVERRLRPAVAGAIASAIALPVAHDIARQGYASLDLGQPTNANHAMDDRSGVHWLMRERRPGDAILTTRLGWPAIWWYGGISLAEHTDGALADGTRMYKISDTTDPNRCTPWDEVTRRHPRLLLFVSFPDMSPAAFVRLEREAQGIGSLAARRDFTSATRVTVIRVDGASRQSTPQQPPNGEVEPCLVIEPAVRW